MRGDQNRRRTGAAAQLKDAILVNPYSAEDIADSIRTALRMPKQERIERWRKLQGNVQSEDIGWWRRRFTDALMAAPARQTLVPAE